MKISQPCHRLLHATVRATLALLLISASSLAVARALPHLAQASHAPTPAASPSNESNALKTTEKAYSLTLVFMQSPIGHTIDTIGIPVTITTAQGNMVFQTTVQGPYLLIKLPFGRYKVRAVLNGIEQVHEVSTGGAKNAARLVFDWK